MDPNGQSAADSWLKTHLQPSLQKYSIFALNGKWTAFKSPLHRTPLSTHSIRFGV